MCDFRTAKILPLVYDESLSYYEAIAKIYDAVNQALEYVYNYNITVLAESKAYTDGELGKYKVENSAELTRLTGEISRVENELSSSMSDLYTFMVKYTGNLDAKFVSSFQQLKSYIDEVFSSVTRIYVTNPKNGNVEPLQSVINDIYSNSQIMALTCWEWDSMQLRADSLKYQTTTAMDYENKTRFVFLRELYMSMHSPITGEMVSYDSLINQLFDLHKKGLVVTASEYDAKLLTAQVYDSKMISASSYDWNSKILLA